MIAISNYGFIQKRGHANYVKGDGDIAAGNPIFSHGSGAADLWVDGEEEQIFGYALTADAADTSLSASQVVFAAMINCGV